MTLIRVVVLSLFLISPLSAADFPLRGQTIIVDAGHGTINFDNRIINGGKSTYDGIPEHQLNIEIGDRVTKALRKLGATVFQTRNAFHYWRPSYNSVDDNKARAIYANELNADALISIHCDWHPRRSVHGVTTLYAKPNSKKMGAILHKNMIRTLKAKDRKLKKDRFTILDHAQMPAVIVEVGFMSHRSESRKLLKSSYQNKVAKALAKGMTQYVTSQ